MKRGTQSSWLAALVYGLMAVAGVWGVYLSLPIELDAQSSLETVDLVINLTILGVSSILILLGSVLTTYCVVLPGRVTPDGRVATFALLVASVFQLPRRFATGQALLQRLALEIVRGFGIARGVFARKKIPEAKRSLPPPLKSRATQEESSQAGSAGHGEKDGQPPAPPKQPPPPPQTD